MKRLIIISILLLAYFKVSALEHSWSNTLQAMLNNDNCLTIDYKPELQISQQISENYFIDFDFIHALNFQTDFDTSNSELNNQTYRAWLRLAGDHFSLRGGRQKINFGPARLLRTLRWFDTLNPLDPRQESTGVDALMARYYFLDNQNIWFWLIDCEKGEMKGNESLASGENIEPGFRVQIPWDSAEFGLSAHHRRLESQEDQTKIAGDFFIDYILGFWGEYSYQIQTDQNKNQFTLGTDYTVSFITGLHFTGEYYQGVNDQAQLALSLDFPVSIFDTAMISYFYQEDGASVSANWQRTYDQFSWYLIMSHSDYFDKTKNSINVNVSYNF